MSTSYTPIVRTVTGGRYTKIVKDVSSGSGGGGGTSSGDTNPGSGATIGEMFFNTTLDKLYVWNGSAWVDVT